MSARILSLRLWWFKWREEHRVVTMSSIGRIANRVANDPKGASVEHWLAIDRFLRELNREVR